MSDDQRNDLISAVKAGNIAKVNKLIDEFELSHSKASSIEYTLLRDAIQAAVEVGHLEIIKDLLKHGADVNSLISSGKGNTLLHHAANINKIEVVKLLINHDADVNTKNGNDHLPICCAIKNENVEMTGLLLLSGTEIKYFPDLLHHAVKSRSMEIFRMILSVSGLDVNTTDDEFGLTALHWTVIPKVSCDIGNGAAAVSNVDIECEMASAILSRGANVNAQWKNGETALHCAVNYGQIGVVEILLKHEADVNSIDESEQTPLHYSARHGNEAIVIMLLKNGARINDKDVNGNTALHIACMMDNEMMDDEMMNYEMMYDEMMNDEMMDNEMMDNEMVDNEMMDNERMDNEEKVATLLEFDADIDSSKSGVVEILLKHDADVNSMNKKEQTPLHFSAQRDNEAIATMLLKNGARINDKDSDGSTPLNLACSGYKTNVATLLEFGADIDTRDQLGRSPIHTAVEYASLSTVSNLLKFFPDTECRDIYGRTALHIAVKHYNFYVVGALLEHGSDINVTCNDGHTPFSRVDDDGSGRHLFFCMLTRGLLIQHILEMKALNMYVSPIYLKLTDIENNHEDFYDNCRLEVETGKNEKIGDTNVTFHDIMTNDIDKLALYARNTSIVETLESGIYKEKFLLYGNMIHINFKKGQYRESLLNQSAKSLKFLSGYALPGLVSVIVLKNLSNGELRNLIKAFAPDVTSGDMIG